MVRLRDGDIGPGGTPGRGKAKVAATVLVRGMQVVRDFTQIVTEVLGWFN